MVEKIKNNRVAVLLLLTGAVYFFLKEIVPLTAPVLVAMLFVTIFGPLLQKMQAKLRLHRQVGAVLLLLLACAFAAALAWVLFSSSLFLPTIFPGHRLKTTAEDNMK